MKTMPRALIVVTIISMIVLACNFFNQFIPSDRGDSGPANETANPITIKVSVDQSALATGVISPAGGSLTATAADGSLFTLTLPAGALLGEEQITLIPITTVDGMPLSGGFVAGVQLLPDGLQLLEPATLVISTPKAVPSGDLLLVGFAYHGAGEEFYLTPSTAAGTTITMQVTHFSGRGLGKGTKADVKKQQKEHSPSSPADDMDQLLAPLVPDDAEPVSLIPAHLHQWWEKKGLEKRLEAASTDENLLEPGLVEFLQFLDKVKENKLEGEFVFDIEVGWGFLGNGVVNAVDKAYTACVNQNDVTQAGNIWRWISWAERWPEMKASIGPDRLAKMREKAQKCLSFELEFDAVISMQLTEAYSVDAHIRAVVPIKVQEDGAALVGQAPLKIVSYDAYLSDSWIETDCKIEFSTPEDSQFEAALGLFNPNLMVGRDPNRFDPVLKYSLGELIEKMSIVCPVNDEEITFPTDWGIRGGYQFLHAAEMGKPIPGGIPNEGAIEARIWNGRRGQWTKIYDRTMDFLGVGTISENTTLTLKHTPEK